MKTLLFGYALVTIALLFEPSFKTPLKEADVNPWYSLNTLLEYSDVMGRLTIDLRYNSRL